MSCRGGGSAVAGSVRGIFGCDRPGQEFGIGRDRPGLKPPGYRSEVPLGLGTVGENVGVSKLLICASMYYIVCVVIVELIWDDWNEEHILKHGCTVDDVKFMCSRRVHHFRDSYKGRRVFLGENANGRVLAVVLGPVPNAPLGTYYPFSARPASPKERRFYERKEREANAADR